MAKHAKEQPSKTSRTVGIILIVVGCVVALIGGIFAVINADKFLSTKVAINSAPSIYSLDADESSSRFEAKLAAAQLQAQLAAETRPNTVADAPEDFTKQVKPVIQMGVLEGGCEIASLTANLQALGYKADMTDIADNYLVYDDETQAGKGYTGSPYWAGSGFPYCIAATANAYLANPSEKADEGNPDKTAMPDANTNAPRFDQAESEEDAELSSENPTINSNAPFVATEIDGYSLDDLLSYTKQGWPVLVWTTMFMQPAMHTGIYMGKYEWYDNEHCVLIFGEIDASDPDALEAYPLLKDPANQLKNAGMISWMHSIEAEENDDPDFDESDTQRNANMKVLVMDPMEGLVLRDKAEFEKIYKDCGKLAVLISSK